VLFRSGGGDVEEKLRQVIATGEPTEVETMEAPTSTRPGIRRTFQHNLFPVRSPDGTVVGVSCAVRDVTQPAAAAADAHDPHHRRQLEDQLAQSEAALDAAHRELEAFSVALTHDLRSPLLIVTNFTHRLRQTLSDSLGEQDAADLERIAAAGRHMVHIMDDLRDLGDVNRVEIRREEVDLSRIGQEIIDDLRARFPKRAVVFEAKAGIEAFADRRLSEILLTNLLQNAWKYTGPRADAWIELGVVQDEYDVPIYHVRDNGIGFDNAEGEEIFEVFQRLHSHSEFTGTGLGLATVERIVRRHGGGVWADGTLGEGAVFRFTLGSSATESPKG
jgi:light-regulated signal transduction histidine kinase (bacteriophytochrome)